MITAREILEELVSALSNLPLNWDDDSATKEACTKAVKFLAQPEQAEPVTRYMTKDTETIFGKTYEQHLVDALEFIRHERFHADDCVFHMPSPKCSCGLHSCLTDIRAVLNHILDHPVASSQDRDAERYRFIKSQMRVGSVQTQLPLYKTLHWIGYEECDDARYVDEAIDAAIAKEGK